MKVPLPAPVTIGQAMPFCSRSARVMRTASAALPIRARRSAIERTCCARPLYACSPAKRRFGEDATVRASASAGSPGVTPQRPMPTSSST